MRRLSRHFNPGRRTPKRALVLAAAILIFLVSACGSPDPTATPTALPAETPDTDRTPAERTFAQEWDELIAAAQEEGQVTIAAGGQPSRSYAKIFRIFQDKFGITVVVGRGSGLETANRLLAEQGAGRYAVDLGLISTQTSVTTLLPADAVIPVDPWLFHPEVVDKSLWWGGRHWYGDEARQYVFLYSASVSSAISQVWYNTNMLSADDLADIGAQGYQGFLDPKWKGRIATQVPTTSGGGLGNWVTAYQDPGRGPEWVERLMIEADLTFSDSRTVIADWVARGRFPITILSNVNDQLDNLRSLGSPVEQAEVEEGLEDLSSGGSGSVILVMKNPPSPNATKLFLNWFLSRDGQTVIHENAIGELSRQSLREDIPFGHVIEEDRRVPGRDYIYSQGDPGYQEAFVRDGETVWEMYQRLVVNR